MPTLLLQDVCMCMGIAGIRICSSKKRSKQLGRQGGLLMTLKKRAGVQAGPSHCFCRPAACEALLPCSPLPLQRDHLLLMP